jgi:hypothetical protein
MRSDRRQSRISNFGFRVGAATTLFLVMAVGHGSAYVTSRILSSTNEITEQRWASLPISWSMNPTVGSNITGTREQAEVLRQSFASWAAIPPATISFNEGAPQDRKAAYDGVNIVTSSLLPSEYPSGALGIAFVFTFDSPGGVDQFGRPIQFAGQIMEVDIAFNPQEPFTTDETTVSDRADLQSVATHEIGHLLGLDHTTLLSSTMFPIISEGVNYAKALSTDDMIGVSTIYPSAAFAATGTLSGTVRNTSNVPVYGAIVVAVNASGQPVASAITDPGGLYTIAGLDPGTYTVYAEPMDGPFQSGNAATLARIHPGAAVNTSFTTRFR